MSSASSARPARSPCRPPASTATRSSTASWTTRSKCPPDPPVSPPLAPLPPPAKPRCPAKNTERVGGLGVPPQLPAFPCPVCPERRQPYGCCVASRASSPQPCRPPVLPFVEGFRCAQVAPWEFRSLLLGACETPGNPGAVEGRGQAFSCLL